MHKMFLQSVTAVIVSLGLNAPAAEYSLDQLIDTALATSKSLASVDHELKKADAQIREAWGGALPKITASINQSHAFYQYIPYNVGGGGNVDQQQFYQSMSKTYQEAGANPDLNLTSDQQELLTKLGPTMSGVTMQELMSSFDGAFETPKNTTSLSVAINQPIFAQGKVSIGLRIARSYKNTLLKKYEGEKHKIITSVTSIYLSAIMARNNVAIQKESVDLAAETHRLTIIRHAIGKGTELDTLTSRLHLENARIDLEKAQSECLMAYETIMVQCGLSGNASSLVVTGDLPVPDFTITINEAISRLHAANDQLLQLESGETIQNELVNLARTDYYPMVYASGSYNRIGMYNFDQFDDAIWGNDCKVTIGLSWELFSGATRRQRMIQKAQDRDMYILSKKQATDGLELATRNAFEKVTVDKNRYQAMSNVVALAEKGYTIAKKAFEIGSGTQLDMQNAELEFNKARLAFNAALLGYNLALIELNQLIGNF